MENNIPLVSIITIVFNGEKVLERTIQSVIAQTYNNYEYIIIDGGSKDNTHKIISQYKTNISKLISEPDKGLYDAMNKGIKASRGKYLWFMNAGDTIFASDTMEKIFSSTSDADIFYGEAEYYSEEGKVLGLRGNVTPHKYPAKLFTWKDMKMGQVVCHQSFIAKKEIAPYYDLEHPLSGDIDWMIKCLKNSKKTVDTGLIITRYLTGGVSVKKHRENMIDRFKVLSKHFGTLPTIWNHLLIVKRALSKKRKA